MSHHTLNELIATGALTIVQTVVLLALCWRKDRFGGR